MRTQFAILRKYFFPHATHLWGAFLVGLVGLVANAASLALLAAMTQMLLGAAGVDTGLPASDVAGGTLPRSLDISQWYSYLGFQLDASLATRGLVWTLVALAVLYLLVRGLDAATELANTHLLWTVRSRAARYLMYDLFAHVSELSLDFFNRSRVGDLSSRITGDVEQHMVAMFKMTQVLLSSLPLAIFYWIAILRLNLQLSLVAVGTFSLSYLIMQALRAPLQSAVTGLSNAMADMRVVLQESFSGISLVKAHAAEKFEQARMGDKLDQILGPAIRFGVIERGIRPVNRFFQDTPAVLVLLFGAYLILSERIDVASLILFVYLLRQVRAPTIDLIGGLYVHYQTAVGFSRQFEALFAERASVPDGKVEVAGFERSLALNGVSFTYESRESGPALKDVSLSIGKGEVVALVGPSGAGKSTLASLLLRFYDPTQGHILLDGRDIRDFRLSSYRALFGVVTQETILFHDTVRNNIAYGLPPGALAQEEIVAAAKVANAHPFIEALPDGYESIIGDRGLRLSGGQRQRLAIARAVLRNPEILVLDEATSSLDSELEALVQEAIDRLLVGRTAIVIAHRLSTIRNADRLAVVDAGRIVEAGSHEQLLDSGGLYARLYETQYSEAAILPKPASAR